MATLIAYYSRMGENYFGRNIRSIPVVNTEKDIAKAARGAKVEKGLAIHGSHVDDAEADIRKWIKK